MTVGGFAVRSGIHGYCRKIAYLKYSANNRAATVLNYLAATQTHGFPSREHADKGGENVNVARFMIEFYSG